MRVSADRSGRAFSRCGYSPDLLATLQGNPGQPTPFFASVATLAVLALPPIIALALTALVVRHIFDLRLQGYGFRKIALQLNAEKSLLQGAFTTWRRGGKICGAKRRSGTILRGRLAGHDAGLRPA